MAPVAAFPRRSSHRMPSQPPGRPDHEDHGGRAGGVGHGNHCSRRLGDAISLHIVVVLPLGGASAIILTRCPMVYAEFPGGSPLDVVANVVIADGAMGTMLQRYDLTLEDFQQLEGCNEILNLTRPDIVRAIHDAYFEVGVDAVETNTFGAIFLLSGSTASPTRSQRWLRPALGSHASRPTHSTPDRPRWVLGSVGPGTKLPTLGHVSYARLRDAYQQQVEGLIAGGRRGVDRDVTGSAAERRQPRSVPKRHWPTRVAISR